MLTVALLHPRHLAECQELIFLNTNRHDTASVNVIDTRFFSDFKDDETVKAQAQCISWHFMSNFEIAKCLTFVGCYFERERSTSLESDISTK